MNERITKAIAELQKSLNDLEPAKDHVLSAQRVTKAVEVIPGELSEMTKSIEGSLLGTIDKLKDENTSFTNKVESNFQESINKFDEIIEELPNEFSNIAKDFDTVVKKHLSNFETSANELIESVELENEKITALRESVQEYYEYLKSIDIPIRFNSLEGHVSSIASGTNNLQNNITNLNNELIRIDREQSKSFGEKFEILQKQNKTITIIAGIAAVFALIAVATNFIG